MKILTRTLIIMLTCNMAVFASEQAVIDGGRGDVPLHLPAKYNADSPTPLVVLLHGYTSSGKQQDSYMKFSKLVDTFGYILATPDGTKEKEGRKVQFWNATEACCNFQGSSVDDSAYLGGLIEKVKSEYNIDANRVYLIGHSNGGFMSYRMAYDHPDTIAAIVSLAGSSPASLDGDSPVSPVNILQIHGTNDTTIKFEGSNIGATSYPGAEETVKLWATYNGCASDTKALRKKLDLDKRIDGKETLVTRYTSDCNPGGAVELWAIQGGAHIPSISDTFSSSVIEWLFDHPKDSSKADTD